MVCSLKQRQQSPTQVSERVCQESRDTLSIVRVPVGLVITQVRDFTLQLILQAPSFAETCWMSQAVEPPPAVPSGSTDSVSRARKNKRLDRG